MPSITDPLTVTPEPNSQEMTSLAHTLESSSRRIWALRHEHSWEFDGDSDANQQIVLSHWRAEYEMWADTVLVIQDGQIFVDAANAAYGNASMPGNGEDREPRREERLGFQGLNGEIRDQGSWTQHPIAPQQQPSSPPQQIPSQQQHSPQQQRVPQTHPSPSIQSLSMSSTSKPPLQNSQSHQTIQNVRAQPSLPQTAKLLPPLPYNPHLVNPQHPQTPAMPPAPIPSPKKPHQQQQLASNNNMLPSQQDFHIAQKPATQYTNVKIYPSKTHVYSNRQFANPSVRRSRTRG